MRVVRAHGLDHALGVLADESEPPRMLAGGTDLMVEIANGRSRPGLVLDLWKLGELRGVRPEDGGEASGDGLRLGALTTCAELRASPLVAEHAPLLARAAREVGAAQIQERATLGGNLGTASPAADLNPVLFALGARVRLASRGGLRELPVEELVTGYRATALAHGELIESVWVPRRDPRARQAFRKVGTRRAQSIAKVVVALELVPERDGAPGSEGGGRIARARAAAGSVAERTLRLSAFERALTGAAPDPALFADAARRAAREDARPQDDVRSTAAYRREVLARVLSTLLRELFPMTAVLVLLALCLGVAASLQGHANGALSGRIGLAPTLWLNALVVFAVAGAWWLAAGRGRPVDTEAPWWMHLGGAYGLAIIAGAAFAFPRLGAGPTMALVVAAQLVTALALDHAGATGPRVPVTPVRIVGALLLVTGAVLVLWPRLTSRG